MAPSVLSGYVLGPCEQTGTLRSAWQRAPVSAMQSVGAGDERACLASPPAGRFWDPS